MALRNSGINQWKWGYNTFVRPEDLSVVLPAYYDAPVNTDYIKNGIINQNACTNLTTRNQLVAYNPGGCSIMGQRLNLLPSEHILQELTTATNELIHTPSLLHALRVLVFETVTIDSIPMQRIAKEYIQYPTSKVLKAGAFHLVVIAGKYNIIFSGNPDVGTIAAYVPKNNMLNAYISDVAVGNESFISLSTNI